MPPESRIMMVNEAKICSMAKHVFIDIGIDMEIHTVKDCAVVNLHP